ncbi:MAG: hypothetical protein Q8O67_26855 [Deltaproteobacteria bacterium]|nr:hypothetical protein [Deltaproteobacteria bacterium]
MRSTLFLAFVVAVPAWAEPARAVAADAEFQQGFVPVIPVLGAVDVPTNPLILVRDAFGELSLVDDGAAITEITTTPATGNSFASLTRVIPTADLRPETHYRLRFVEEGLGDDLASFTTGAGRDDQTPAPPELEAQEGNRISIESDEIIEVVSVTAPGATAYFDVVDAGGITVQGEGRQTFSIIALDRAGNSSEPVEIDIDLVQVVQPLGCSCPNIGGNDVVVGCAFPLIGLRLLRRRRRR